MILVYALVIALLTWLVATAFPMWLRWSCYFGAPLVAGLIYGLMMGDVAYGLKTGATVMMAYIGMVAIGGALPSDMALAGYLGVAMTMLAKADPSVGLTIAVPLGFLGLLCANAKMSLNSIWVHKADQYAAEGNTRGVILMNMLASQIIPFLTYFIPSFLCVYFGSNFLQGMLAAIPTQIISILKLVGHLIPALGLAMLMNFLMKKSLIPFFIVGFVLAAYLKLTTMPVALLGAAFGILHLLYTFKNNAVLENNTGTDAPTAEEEGSISELSTSGQSVSLDKKTLRKSWLNWICWGQICYNYERMMGLGFCQCMIPVLKKLYPNDKEKLAEGMTRHLTFYNTENTWGAVIPGIVAALEEQRANHDDIDNESINNLKTALMGPMAGIGDSITQGLVKVILLAMGIGMASQGNPMGPVLFVVLFSAYALIVSYTTYFSGYRLGKNAVTRILSGGLIKQITEGLGAMGMTVLGCLVATMIPISTPLSFMIGENETKIQALLDQIMPALLPAAIFLGIYALLRKRIKPVTIIAIIFTAAIVLSLCNILV